MYRNVSAALFVRPKNLITIYVPKNREGINLIIIEAYAKALCSHYTLHLQEVLMTRITVFLTIISEKKNTKWYK